MSPVSTDLDVRLRDAAVADEQPEPKDGLGEDVKNSICEDFRVNGRLAGTIGEAPNAG